MDRLTSMRPRLLSRGWTSSRLPRRGASARFNGAAASQPRKAAGMEAAAEPTATCFNGAAAFQPRKASCRQCRKRHWTCFNGAAAFQPRKGRVTIESLAQRIELQWGRGFCRGKIHPPVLLRNIGGASMGPRLFSRGKVHVVAPQRWPYLLQWGRGFSAAESCPSRPISTSTTKSFNGAAAFQPRKGPDAVHLGAAA